MKLLKTYIGILLLISGNCFGQEKKESDIDIGYQNCLDKDTSVANICDCSFITYGKWNKEMDNIYNKLLRTLKKEDDKNALKQSQEAWKTYRDAEFNSYDYMFNNPGLKFCLLRQQGRIDIVRMRALQLQQYLDAFKAPAR